MVGLPSKPQPLLLDVVLCVMRVQLDYRVRHFLNSASMSCTYSSPSRATSLPPYRPHHGFLKPLSSFLLPDPGLGHRQSSSRGGAGPQAHPFKVARIGSSPPNAMPSSRKVGLEALLDEGKWILLLCTQYLTMEGGTSCPRPSHAVLAMLLM